MMGGNFNLNLVYHSIELKKDVCAPSKIKLKKNKHKKGFDFAINAKTLLQARGLKHPESYGLNDEIIINDKKNGRELSIGRYSIQNAKVFFNKKTNAQLIKGTVTNLKTGLNTEYKDEYWRLVLEIDLPPHDIIYPAEVLDCYDNFLSFDNKEWDTQVTLLGIRIKTIKNYYSSIIINSKTFHFYIIEDLNALFIDSTCKLSHTEFKRISGIIRSAFGFLTGRYYRNEAYYVSSLGKDFKKTNNVCFETEESVINTKKEIVNPSIFRVEFDESSKEFQEKNKKYRSNFSLAIFSKLCDEMYQHEVLHRTIEIILSAVSNNSPLQQAALYSVALETIEKFSATENPESTKVIKDDKTWESIRNELIKVVDNTSVNLDKEQKKFLTDKITNTNQPTNRNKLLIPFQLYKIELDKTDIKTLDSRNRFLHGESPIDINEKFEIEIIGLKIHFLIACLILKYVGYEGHVVNIPVWHYFGNNDKVAELMEKLNIEGLPPVSEINKMAENGDIEGAKKELTRLIDASQAGAKISNPFKII